MTEPPKTPWKSGVKAVQDSLRTALPKRFYKTVGVGERDGGWGVQLDGRPVRTPAKKFLAVPSKALAEALAAEWQAQVTEIDPATMPVTRLINSALDGVTGRETEVAAEIVKYAGSDLLLYRAEAPQVLIDRQAAAWDPVVTWAEGWAGGRFILAAGIMPVTQPQGTLGKIAANISTLPAIPLAGLNVMTTITGSALLSLAHAHGHLTLQQAWAAAHIDEDFQIEKWGTDDEAAQRRSNRWQDMQAASLAVTFSAA
jgi:chaperone required for assembly of F1-ATPase